jgi:hypothetical protein
MCGAQSEKQQAFMDALTAAGRGRTVSRRPHRRERQNAFC